MNNELRDAMQREAVDAVMNDRRVIVEWGTGTGKSRVAVGAVTRLLSQGRHRILLLVCETMHKANWRSEFTAALGPDTGEDVFSCLTVECYNSLVKYTGTVWDLVIADEAHHLRSEIRTGALCSITADRVLCLSATMNDRHDADDLLACMQETFGPFRSFRFTLQQSIDSGILARPRVFVHVMALRRVETPVTIAVEWGQPKARRHADTDARGFRHMWENPAGYPHMDLSVTCSALDAYRILDAVYSSCEETCRKEEARRDALEPGSPARQAAEFRCTLARNRMLQYALRRKDLLGTLKTGYAGHILRDIVRDRKYICFCSSIEQGAELGADTVIHSKRAPGENDAIIRAFQEGRSRSLFAVGMAQEGANLTGIQTGVVIQLGSKERRFVQQFGRAMRSDNPEQHIIVFLGTRDIDYLTTALDGIDPRCVTYINSVTGLPMKPSAPARPASAGGLSNSAKGGARTHA